MSNVVELGLTSAKGTVPRPATMDVEELLATRLLVQGNSGSGKSYLLRRLMEQSAPLVQQVVVDPEGDFTSLADAFGHVVVDAARGESDLRAIAARIRERRVSAVLNLESLEVDSQMTAASVFLDTLFEAEREHWFPCLVFVDEAQLFAPAGAADGSEEARRKSLAAMTNLMCRGRKRGLAGIIATQRLAKLAKNVAAEASNFLMGRTFLDIDMARAADLLGMDRRQAEMFRDLDRGNFVALGPALSRTPLPLKVGTVVTQARGSTPKLELQPVQVDADTRAEILAAAPMTMRPHAERRPAPPPQPSTHDVLTQMVRDRPEAIPPDPEEAARATAAREDALARVVADMLEDGEPTLPVPSLYNDFSVRCRIAKIQDVPGLSDFRRRMTLARAMPLPPEATEGEGTSGTDGRWDEAVRISATLPEDVQGVFLLFAKAAMEGGPCPSDLDVARVCGSQSPGRASRLVARMEQDGHIVIRLDMRKRRAVHIPGLGWETAHADAVPRTLPGFPPARMTGLTSARG